MDVGRQSVSAHARPAPGVKCRMGEEQPKTRLKKEGAARDV